MKKILFVFLLNWMIWLFPLMVFALEESLPLKKALEIAESLSPEVVLSKQNSFIAQKDRLKANRYPNPEINFQVGPNYETLEAGDTQKNVYLGGTIQQEVELWGKRKLRQQIADDQIFISKIEELITEQDMIGKVKTIYAAIQRSQERVSLIRSNLEIHQRFVGSAQMKFQQNKAPYADVLRAKMELAVQHKNLILEQNELKILKQQMNLLLDRDLETPFRASDSFREKSSLPSLSTLLTKMIQRAEFDSIEARKGQNQKEIRLAKQEAKPNLKVGFWGQQDPPDLNLGASLGMQLPVWYRNKGEIESAKAKKLKLEYQKNYLARKIELEVRNRYFQLLRVIESIALQQEMIQTTGELFRTTFQAYQEGNADFLRFLETLQSVNRFKSDYYDTLFEYWIKKGDLERAIGGPLSGAL